MKYILVVRPFNEEVAIARVRCSEMKYDGCEAGSLYVLRGGSTLQSLTYSLSAHPTFTTPPPHSELELPKCEYTPRAPDRPFQRIPLELPLGNKDIINWEGRKSKLIKRCICKQLGGYPKYENEVVEPLWYTASVLHSLTTTDWLLPVSITRKNRIWLIVSHNAQTNASVDQ